MLSWRWICQVDSDDTQTTNHLQTPFQTLSRRNHSAESQLRRYSHTGTSEHLFSLCNHIFGFGAVYDIAHGRNVTKHAESSYIPNQSEKLAIRHRITSVYLFATRRTFTTFSRRFLTSVVVTQVIPYRRPVATNLFSESVRARGGQNLLKWF